MIGYVIIDDLDRCSDAKIVEVLEAVRLIIDLPNVVVILTVDQSIMISAVANKFSLQNKNLKWERALALARDFIGKIIQISIELEAPDSRQTRHFVANRLYPETSTIEEIATHISSGRNIGAEIEEENAFNQAFEEATESPLKLKALFLGTDVFDEDITDVEPSSEYLTHSAREVEVFSKCVGAFNICNPRTLVRLHNTITVLKGLNPELVDDNELLDIHIFMAFVQEAFAMRSDPNWSELDGLFTSTTSLDSPYCSRVKLLSSELGISNVLNSEIVKIAGRLRRLSLTSVAMMISEEPEHERTMSN